VTTDPLAAEVNLANNNIGRTASRAQAQYDREVTLETVLWTWTAAAESSSILDP
jgi:hypothetical protein